MQFGEKLKRLRVTEGYTQKGLSNALEIGERSIQNYELNEREPNYCFIQKICKKFPEYALWLISDHAEVASIKNKALSNQ